jgi:hypothetical protein
MRSLPVRRTIGVCARSGRLLRPAFADLIGSTSFAESLDPEDARDLLGGAVERLVLAIEELGGPLRISRETAYSHFSERPWRTRTVPSEPYARACGSSKKSLPTAGGLSVRVGIESGLVVLGPVGAGSRIEYGATGDAVNTAARLQAAAPPGAVLVGAATQRQIAPLFEWAPPQELELKGKARPFVPYRVVGVRAEPGRLRGLEGVEAPLVGRDRELTAARRTVTELPRGEGGLLVILGEESARAGSSPSSAFALPPQPVPPPLGCRARVRQVEARLRAGFPPRARY